MAASSELERMLAKRRSCGEETFESNGSPSPAHVGGASAAAERSPWLAYTSADDPPWLAYAADEGVAFSGRVVDAGEAPEDPPWLQTAVECGVVFLDPDGNEVKIPSSKVVAFKAALESVDAAFDHSREGSVAAAPSGPSDVGASATRNSEGSPQGGDGSVVEETQESQRQALKAAVQRRYFALLREGLEPTEAAVQAICEVKTGKAACAADAQPASQSGGSPREGAASSSCGSSVRQGTPPDGTARSHDQVAVAA